MVAAKLQFHSGSASDVFGVPLLVVCCTRQRNSSSRLGFRSRQPHPPGARSIPQHRLPQYFVHDFGTHNVPNQSVRMLSPPHRPIVPFENGVTIVFPIISDFLRRCHV
ncbi:unnamed protein product [Polarella glacialis]|uniref:Uncharacterized protein n=1 Tax=Polarella glacialis TaxID=89957 RepID=A0A813FCJ6_POLGL|nr:unnamed protein product [Polarella glacialis]